MKGDGGTLQSTLDRWNGGIKNHPSIKYLYQSGIDMITQNWKVKPLLLLKIRDYIPTYAPEFGVVNGPSNDHLSFLKFVFKSVFIFLASK